MDAEGMSATATHTAPARVSSHPLPSGLIDLALFFGEIRAEANRARYADRPDKRRDGTWRSGVFGHLSRELYTEAIGVLGELAVRTYLDRTGRVIRYTASAIVKPADRIDDDCDLIAHLAGGKRIPLSVKATESPRLAANCRAVAKDGAPWIWFVRPTRDRFQIWRFRRPEIRSWTVNTSAFSPFYEFDTRTVTQ